MVASKSLEKDGTMRKYKIDETKKYNMRVKLTCNFSAAEIITPLFISVVGLTEPELPRDRNLVQNMIIACKQKLLDQEWSKQQI